MSYIQSIYHVDGVQHLRILLHRLGIMYTSSPANQEQPGDYRSTYIPGSTRVEFEHSDTVYISHACPTNPARLDTLNPPNSWTVNLPYSHYIYRSTHISSHLQTKSPPLNLALIVMRTLNVRFIMINKRYPGLITDIPVAYFLKFCTL